MAAASTVWFLSHASDAASAPRAAAGGWPRPRRTWWIACSRARSSGKIRYPQPGAVTFTQRFGDALNLNVHFHVLALDGVFDADDPAGIMFIRLDPPSDIELLRIVRAFARRLKRLLERHGLSGDGHGAGDADSESVDPLSVDEPWLAELCGASVVGRAASGPRAGQRLRRLGDRIDPDALAGMAAPGCVQLGGINLHAAVAVPANDRLRLERLCRYVARPAVATERLARHESGLLIYKLRHRWRDGTTSVLFEPMELMERLAVLIPPPRAHQVRYLGILAPNASCREQIVPAPELDAEARVARKAARHCYAQGANAGSAEDSTESPTAEATDAPAFKWDRRQSARGSPGPIFWHVYSGSIRSLALAAGTL